MTNRAVFLFIATLLSLVTAEEIKFDNRFLANDNNGLTGWSLNPAEAFKPFGDVLPAMYDCEAGARLVSKGKYTAIMLDQDIPAQNGDKFRFTFTVQGKGSYEVGFYQYGENWKWCGSVAQRKATASEPEAITVVYTISREDVTKIRPVLAAHPGGDVSITGLKIEKNPTDGEESLQGWTFNSADEFKPFGKVKSYLKDGVKSFHLTSRGKYTAIFQEKGISAKTQDQIRISCRIQGKGSCEIGFYQYGKNWKWCGQKGKRLLAKETGEDLNFTLTVTGDETLFIHPSLATFEGGDVVISNLKIEKLPKQAE